MMTNVFKFLLNFRCPTYSNLPSICHLEQQPGQCCKTPKCEYNQQFGTFSGNGMISGKGSGMFYG